MGVLESSKIKLRFARILLLHLIQRGKTHIAPAVIKDSWEESELNSETPVLLEFYVTWCGPCRMVHRVIDEIAVEYAGRLKCFVLDTDDDRQIAEDHELKGEPVGFLFKNGEKRETVIGTMPKEFYVAAIEWVLKL